jgi:hypothetical protein
MKRERYFYVFDTNGKRREMVFPAASHATACAYVRSRKKLAAATGWTAEMRPLSARLLRELQKQFA